MVSDQHALQASQSTWTQVSESSRIWQQGAAENGWVFGLEWTATLGRRSRRWLFTQLRQQHVRWFASAGPLGELIGFSRAVWRDATMPTLGVAAVAYAQSRPQGSHLLCLTVDPTRQWVVGVHQGKLMTHTDKWIDPEAFEPLRQVLAQRFADLVVDSVQWLDPSDAPPAALSFLQQTAAHTACFQRLRPTLVNGANALLLAGAIICLLGAFWMWQSFNAWPVGEPTAQEIDEHEAASLGPSKPVVEVHDSAALLKVLHGLQQLPVNPAHWSLRSAQCQLASDVVQCSAHYERHQKKTDNEALAQIKPLNWHLKPVAIDETILETQLRVGTQALKPTTSQDLEAWLITLQRQTTITPDLRLGSWRNHAVTHTGRQVRSREVNMRLPVRQWARLRDWSLPVYWQSIQLELVPDATIDEHHGYIMFNLKGELRAIE